MRSWCGLALSIPLSVARTSKNPLLNWPVWAYTYFFRGTPLLIQLFLIYYGLGQFQVVQNSVFWPLLKQASFCAVLAFALNTAAYTTEILRGAIEVTPTGEIEAAKAAGMSPLLMLRRIVLPSAFRRAIPAYGNEVIFMLHGSAVASVVTIIDLTGAARLVQSRYYAPFEAFITAGAVLHGHHLRVDLVVPGARASPARASSPPGGVSRPTARQGSAPARARTAVSARAFPGSISATIAAALVSRMPRTIGSSRSIGIGSKIAAAFLAFIAS